MSPLQSAFQNDFSVEAEGSATDLDITDSKVAYVYKNGEKNKIFYWSLPTQFLDNKVHSYMGNMTVWFEFEADGADIREGEDIAFVVLVGNGITLYWNGEATDDLPANEKVVSMQQRLEFSDGVTATSGLCTNVVVLVP